MSQWLVRTAKNVISGPYNKEALCQMILSGELGSQDEVCESGQFWIFLHEREEVAKQLGINLPKPPKNPDEETTETQTQTQTQTQTDTALGGERTPVPMSVTDAEVTEVDEASAVAALAEEMAEEHDGATQVLGRRNVAAAAAQAVAQAPAVSIRPAGVEAAEAQSNGGEGIALPAADGARNMGQPAPEDASAKPMASQPAGPKVVYRPMVLGEIERPSAWRMAIWILVVAAFFLAFWMLRALRR
jgi:hypothetical protein